MSKQYLSGKIITPEGIINGSVSYENGIIGEITAGDAENNYYISPGFIDIHVHGGGGHDFMDGTEEAFLGAAKLHAEHGTTTLLPTTLTCPDEELFHSFDVLRAVQKDEKYGDMFYGMHLEGPYFSADQAGAQDPKYLKKPEKSHYEAILAKADGLITRWTVAPELEGALELGDKLGEVGICASMGHSNALYEEVLEAHKHSYTHLTHFYSGMSALTRKQGYRYPGMIESGYMIDELTVEVICDGKHLPHSMLNYVFRAKGTDKCALVTDAMRGAGMTEGKTILGSLENGQECYIEDGVAKMPGGQAFAGSVATTDRLVRNAIQAGASLTDAVKMMSTTPARLCNMQDRGEIAKGLRADFTIFDEEINIIAVISGGKIIYER